MSLCTLQTVGSGTVQRMKYNLAFDLASEPVGRSTVKKPMAKEPPQEGPKYNEKVYRDPRTGAEYLVREPKVAGPQGDFRIPEMEARHRYNVIMGHTNSFSEHPRTFQELNEEPVEPMVSEEKVHAAARTRTLHQVKRQTLFQATTEEPEWALQTSAEEPSDQFFVDPSGHIRELKYNTEGPFGTEKVRNTSVSKYSLKPETKSSESKVRASVPHGVPTHKLDQDPLELRLRDPKLETLLNSAWRSLFGLALVHNKDSFDAPRKTLWPSKKETERLGRVIANAGLYRVPEERRFGSLPQKPETEIFAIGQKAVESLMNQRIFLEIQELPKAQRDDLNIAVGRAIVNSMGPSDAKSAMPYKIQTQSPSIETFESLGREELKAFLTTIVGPVVLQGLQSPEMISDRDQPETLGHDTRVHGASNRVHVPLDDTSQSTIASLQERLGRYAPQSTRPTIGTYAGQIQALKSRTRPLFDSSTDRNELNAPLETRTTQLANSVFVPFQENPKDKKNKTVLELNTSLSDQAVGLIQF